MNKFSSTKNYLYALLLAIMALMMLPACSSSDEASQSDSNMSCDENDTREECINDIL
jgi:hypothetical protein